MTPAAADRIAGSADDLAFGLALAARAGRGADGPLRAPRADPSQERPRCRDRGRPPVRGADHRRHPCAPPGRRDPRRGERGASGDRRGGPNLRSGPALDHRSAGRHGELRERHPVLLRVDRAHRGWTAVRRRGPRPDPRGDVRGDGRRAGPAGGRARVAQPRDHGVREGQAVRFRRLDGARWEGCRRPVASRAQGDPHLALDGLGGPGARVRRERALRRASSSRAACPRGTSRPPA